MFITGKEVKFMNSLDKSILRTLYYISFSTYFYVLDFKVVSALLLLSFLLDIVFKIKKISLKIWYATLICIVAINCLIIFDIFKLFQIGQFMGFVTFAYTYYIIRKKDAIK